MAVQLGDTCKDIITDFEGVCTGLVSYISGCDQALLVPKVGEDGKIEDGRWFDLQRLTVDASRARITLDNTKTPGPDSPAPIR